MRLWKGKIKMLWAILSTLLVGAVAGWLASKIMGGGGSLVRNIAVGVIGSCVGGLLFGLWWGSVYTFIGAVLNCALMFLLARYVGRSQVQRLVEQKLSPQWQRRLQMADGKEGFLLLIILRLIPAVPYNLINYTFGLTGISFSSYLLASAIGIIPGTFAFINIGDKTLEAGSPSFWIAIGLLVLLLALTGLLGKKLFPGQKNATSSKKNGEQK